MPRTAYWYVIGVRVGGDPADECLYSILADSQAAAEVTARANVIAAREWEVADEDLGISLVIACGAQEPRILQMTVED